MKFRGRGDVIWQERPIHLTKQFSLRRRGMPNKFAEGFQFPGGASGTVVV